MIGTYGAWAAALVGDEPARFSFRNKRFTNLEQWRKAAVEQVRDRLLLPPQGGAPKVKLVKKYSFAGLEVEQLLILSPYGPPY